MDIDAWKYYAQSKPTLQLQAAAAAAAAAVRPHNGYRDNLEISPPPPITPAAPPRLLRRWTVAPGSN